QIFPCELRCCPPEVWPPLERACWCSTRNRICRLLCWDKELLRTALNLPPKCGRNYNHTAIRLPRPAIYLPCGHDGVAVNRNRVFHLPRVASSECDHHGNPTAAGHPEHQFISALQPFNGEG